MRDGDTGASDRDAEWVALPWEFVQDFADKRLNIARVLDAENRLVCRCSPPDADLIVLAVNAYNGEAVDRG